MWSSRPCCAPGLLAVSLLLTFFNYFTLSLFISSENYSIFQFSTIFIVKSPVAFFKALCNVTSSRSLKQLFLRVETFSLLFLGLRTV